MWVGNQSLRVVATLVQGLSPCVCGLLRSEHSFLFNSYQLSTPNKFISHPSEVTPQGVLPAPLCNLHKLAAPFSIEKNPALNALTGKRSSTSLAACSSAIFPAALQPRYLTTTSISLPSPSPSHTFSPSKACIRPIKYCLIHCRYLGRLKSHADVESSSKATQPDLEKLIDTRIRNASPPQTV